MVVFDFDSYFVADMKDILSLWDKSITLQRNDFLQREGDVNTNIYYVVNGSLRIFVVNDDEEQIIRFGYKDNLVVSLDSFLLGTPSSFYIQAIKKTELRIITKSSFDTYLSRGENIQTWIAILESLVVQQMEREIDLLCSSPRERYLRVLQRSPQLMQEIPMRYIANYLRMSPETLSRIKSRR